MKRCPFCAEAIQDAAILCRFCGRELSSKAPDATTETRAEPHARGNTDASRLMWGARLVGGLVGLALGVKDIIRPSAGQTASKAAKRPKPEKPARKRGRA